jgi:hypothetical protein
VNLRQGVEDEGGSKRTVDSLEWERFADGAVRRVGDFGDGHVQLEHGGERKGARMGGREGGKEGGS